MTNQKFNKQVAQFAKEKKLTGMYPLVDEIARHFFEVGREDMKNELLQGAQEHRVYLEYGEPRITLYEDNLQGAKFADKYKIVLIKEENAQKPA